MYHTCKLFFYFSCVQFILELFIILQSLSNLCSFGTSERQWVEAQVENAKQQAILMSLKSQVSSDEAHIHLDLHSLRYTIMMHLKLSSHYCLWFGSLFFLCFLSAIFYSISLTLDLMYVNRRKHSELVGELSNSYNKEEKLLSEVCIYPGFQVSYTVPAISKSSEQNIDTNWGQ